MVAPFFRIRSPLSVLLVDQAGWHMSTRLVVPANATIITLPPKCPELNPVENVWQYMRDNRLSKPNLQIIRRSSLLRGLEQARSALAHHVL
jgi:transposase